MIKSWMPGKYVTLGASMDLAEVTPEKISENSLKLMLNTSLQPQ